MKNYITFLKFGAGEFYFYVLKKCLILTKMKMKLKQ